MWHEEDGNHLGYRHRVNGEQAWRAVQTPVHGVVRTAYAHIHATLASAFSREAVVGTREERNVDEAEVSLINATLILIMVLNSQSEIFSLGLDEETKACWEEVTAVWKDRPHGALARTAPSPSATSRDNS